ncbi:hypothetical protein BUE80_DR009646 [Diplocarpon rosae]|nr:hypothetical protein BUE80_DR009646 [Diplocarpon rosae]
MDDSAFAPDVDLTTQTILLHASNHDLAALKPFLRVPGNASVQDPETGFTPLHAAIAACGVASASSKPADSNGTSGREGDGAPRGAQERVDLSKAKKVLEELFFSGAIWNDLSSDNETPGCMAYRLGQMELYEMCVNAGVRAELLLGLMGGYEELEGEGSGEDDEDADIGIEGQHLGAEVQGSSSAEVEEHEVALGPVESTALASREKKDVNSADYLASSLTFSADRLLDSDNNGVMMSWETSIMRRTVDLLLPSLAPGARVLNIGFGMGIIDRMFRETKPRSHHIIEAHPAVLSKLSSQDSANDFGAAWEQSAPEKGGGYKVHAGRWQDVCPLLLRQGQIFDAIYFDTFGEDYAQLKLFFTEFLPGLMDGEGRFGWFNGLGADRRVCHDVYCKVVEMDLMEAGCDVDWTDVEVPVDEMGGEGEGEWKGVRRRYWVLENYRLPVCRFLG